MQHLTLPGYTPLPLVDDVAPFMYELALAAHLQVPLFKGVEEAFTRRLVVLLKNAVYMPGETLFRRGDVGHEMYIIVKGNSHTKSQNLQKVL